MYLEYLKERYTAEDFAPRTAEQIADKFEAYYTSKGIQFLTLPYGFATIELKGDAMITHDIYIKPEYRRANYASKMAKGAEKLARQYGKRIMIGFSEFKGKNQKAGQSLMESLGFIPTYKLNDKQVYFKEIQ